MAPRVAGTRAYPLATPPSHRAAPASRLRPAPGPAFRIPTRYDPAPHPVRLAAMCVWAAALGYLGLIVAGRVLVALVADQAPGWFEPAVITVGLAGIVLTIGAFLAVHRRLLPWLLLAAATLPLSVNLTVAAVAL